jgi:protein-S-isoprenylcysteine O-methyltransferase Ste14
MSKIERDTTENEERSRVEEYASADDGQRKLPRLVAWIAALATVGTIVLAEFLPRGDNAFVRGAGVCLLALAAALIFAPFFLLRKHGRIEDGGSYMQTRTVVDRGLYSIVRHPQYLGYMLLASGFAFLSQHWLVMVLAAAGIAAFYCQAVEEERTCRARLGAAYAQYMQRVPRFNLVLGAFRVLSRAMQGV